MSDARAAMEQIYRMHARAALATLIRLLGDFDLAEEGLAEAFHAAATQWPRDGMPTNPRAWLVSTGRFKAIDRLRKRVRFSAVQGEIADRLSASLEPKEEGDMSIQDDRLRLIFTCCHPALAPDAQIALALRSVCGLTTEEIARAFLVPAPTLAQRIVRAKAKIRDEHIPYETPGAVELPARLEGVLAAIYLAFNEGYAASAGADLTRADLCAEAIRLAREVADLLPDAEAVGLLALMLLQDSRRAARLSADGELVLLADQDRRLWNRARIAEGLRLSNAAIGAASIGRYALQAGIAARHAAAARAEDTDWSEIVALYDLLLRADPSPIVALNRAVAVAMRDGPQAGLDLIEPLMAELSRYYLAYAARADLLAKLGRADEARADYTRALELAKQEPERRFLAKRIAKLS